MLLPLKGAFPSLQAPAGAIMENPVAFVDGKDVPCSAFSSEEAPVSDVPGTSFRRESDSLEDSKLTGDVSGATACIDTKPKSIHRAKRWSGEVENLYRFQQAGYRDEIEYKQVKHVDMVSIPESFVVIQC